MTRQFLMGIDIGTQSTRVALIDETGKVHASHSTFYEMVTPRQGWAEEDPEDWWKGIVEGIRRNMEAASARPEDIIAIGSDAQMHATIPLDRDGELLSHAVQLWCDKRGSALVDDLKAADPAAAARAAQLAGSPPVAAWIGFKIKWLKVHQPEIYHKTHKFVTGSGFLNYRLTGQYAIDWSEASGTFLLDAKKLDWSPELADYLDVDLVKLPQVYKSTEVVGRVSRAAARLTGLAEGTPVVAGAGDMLCMLLAAGLAERGRALDISGTASDMVVYVDEPVLDPPMMNLHHASPGWTPFGIAEAGGGSLKWFKDALCQAEIAQAKAEGKEPYDILNAKAAVEEPGSEGLLYLPYLMGERVLGSPYSRGVFFGLTPRHGVGSMMRAVMEGVTFELRRTLEIVENAGNAISEIYTSGGGARSALWSQIKADIYQKPVYTLAAEEGGVLGSAILAGAGAGVFTDIQHGARCCVRTDRVFQPQPENFDRYDYLYNLFKDVHDTLQVRFDQLAQMP